MSTAPVEIPFDQNQFNEVCEAIRRGCEELSNKIFPQLRPFLDKFFDFFHVPGWLREAGYKVVRWALDCLEELLNGLIRFFEGLLVPITAWVRGNAWADRMDNLNTAKGYLDDSMKELGVTWQGEGARAFALHGQKHVDKVTALADLAKELRTQCWILAGASLVAYVGIGVAIAKAISVATASAASTVVDGPAGPAGAGAAAGVGVFEIAAIITALLATLGTHISAFINIGDKAAAVEKEWPKPNTGAYSDGSASDGDNSDWSTER